MAHATATPPPPPAIPPVVPPPVNPPPPIPAPRVPFFSRGARYLIKRIGVGLAVAIAVWLIFGVTRRIYRTATGEPKATIVVEKTTSVQTQVAIATPIPLSRAEQIDRDYAERRQRFVDGDLEPSYHAELVPVQVIAPASTPVLIVGVPAPISRAKPTPSKHWWQKLMWWRK